ncbi:hypothetical protein HWV62_4649 [Athelia sp. TMB]|nr:hypothetical protein HWV62_4649 [Athelia sp. TMB]
MDNPWDNGWTDPSTTTTPTTTAKTLWLPEETESDSVTPSWSAAATNDVKWAEGDDEPDAVWTAPATWNIAADADVELSLSSSPGIKHEPEPEPATPAATSNLDPDVLFGGFENGFPGGVTTDPWSLSSSAPTEFASDDHWGSAWAPEHEPQLELPTEADEEPSDEWEAAREQKAKMDQYVPPELLASILQQCAELWPESTQETIDKEDYRADRSSGMSGVPGLEALASRIASDLPPLAVPPIPFARTHTFKSLSEALRLTRHLPMSRTSPMAYLLAAKGSTAWESGVRARSDAKEEIILPAGWRVLGEGEKETVEVEKDTTPKGGLLAFWGRKAGSTPRGASQERSVSPATVNSPRASVEPARSPVHSRAPSLSTILPPVSSATLPALSPTTTPVDTQDLTPSAVSRFFNRFSRVPPKPSPSGAKDTSADPGMGADDPRGLALSPDDIDVLGHFVPSARDSEDDDHEDNRILGERAALGLAGIFASKLPLQPPPPQGQPLNHTAGSADVPNDLDPMFGSSRAATPVARVDYVNSNTSIHSSLHSTEFGPANNPDTMLGTPRVTMPLGRAGSSNSNIDTNIKAPSVFRSVTMSSRPSPTDKPLSTFTLPPPPLLPPPPSSSFATPPLSRGSSVFTMSPPPTRATLPLGKPGAHPPTRGHNPNLGKSSTPARGHTPKPSIVAPPTASLLSSSFDVDESDDDFSAFSSPRSSESHKRSQSGSASALYDEPSFSLSMTPSRPLFASQPPNDSKHVHATPFDDFDFAEFVSSPSAGMGYGVKAPPPPTPPAKGPVPLHKHRESDLLGGLFSPPIAHTYSAPPPPSSSQTLLSFSSDSSFGAFDAAPAAITPKPQSLQPPRAGGLSAQDLSFFEGL